MVRKDVLGAGVSVRVGLSQRRVKKKRSYMHMVTKHLSYQYGSRF